MAGARETDLAGTQVSLLTFPGMTHADELRERAAPPALDFLRRHGRG